MCMRSLFVVVPIVLLLGACGGGGGGGGSSGSPAMQPPPAQQPAPAPAPAPAPEPEPQPQPQPPPPEPEPTFDQATRTTLQSRLDAADTILVAGVRRLATLPRLSTHRLEDLEMSEYDDYERSRILSGMPLAQHVESHPTDDGHYDRRSYAGWLTHSFFHVWTTQSTRYELTVENVLFGEAFSIGDTTGRNPVSGSARWVGGMLGADVSETTASRGRYVAGDARADVDFAASSVTVSFTNIADVATGAREADMIWRDMSLREGSFGIPRSVFEDRPNFIRGSFYGPNHEEVGGVFQRRSILGAFGARRQ